MPCADFLKMWYINPEILEHRNILISILVVGNLLDIKKQVKENVMGPASQPFPII